MVATTAAVALLAACSSDTDPASTATAPAAPVATSDDADPATDPTSTPASTPASTSASTSGPTTGEGAGAWPESFERVVPGGDCQCADGSEFSFYVREADPAKVLLFFQGGGACFSAATCAFEDGSYKVTTDLDDDPSGEGGIFDLGDARNPFRDFSMVYVPYCTGDVHIGDATTDYDGLTVQHKGAVNGRAALAELVERFGDATEVVVAGESAGAVPTPVYAGLVSDELPDARVAVLADGAGAYPDVPAVNELIGGLWGTMNAVPDWSVNEGLTAADWSFPDLFVQAGRHAPDIVFARHDYAYDRTQAFFALLAGVPADDLVTQIDANEAQIEGEGVDLASFISPGDDHTVLSSPEFYTERNVGVALLDWVTDLAAGTPVDDVHCEDCGRP